MRSEVDAAGAQHRVLRVANSSRHQTGRSRGQAGRVKVRLREWFAANRVREGRV